MSSYPKARPGLLRHELDGQTVVYDPATERVHLLDAATGCVLALLDGTRSRATLAAELTRRLGRSCDHELVALSLDELSRAELLDPATPPAEPLGDGTRRELLKKLALTTAAVLIPTVLTVTPAEAQSSALGTGAACSGNSQCASGNCSGANGNRCCAGGGFFPGGSLCAPNGPSSSCCSGVCSGGQCTSV